MGAVEVQATQTPGQALAAARLARSAAAATLEAAAAARAHGELARTKAQARLARYGDLDERIARARAEQLKRGSDRPLPSELMHQLEERRAANDEVGQSAGAAHLLDAEHQAAEKALRDATAALSLEACKLMLAEAGKLADELSACRQRMWEIGDSLLGLDHMLGAAAPTLPSAAVPGLRAQIARLLAVAQADRPYGGAIVDQKRRQVIDTWRQRHKELVG